MIQIKTTAFVSPPVFPPSLCQNFTSQMEKLQINKISLGRLSSSILLFYDFTIFMTFPSVEYLNHNFATTRPAKVLF